MSRHAFDMTDSGSRLVSEWPTLLLLVACYAGFALATTWLADISLGLASALCALCIALHASLSHEALHGHPFVNRHLNAALVFPALSFAIPYVRFRDTHLAHHEDSVLTDPYDDPESNFYDPDVWALLSPAMQGILRINNTLAGRMLIGPAIGQAAFMAADWRAMRRGDRRVWAAWLLHLPAVGVVLWWMIALAQMPLWTYFACVYGALSVLKLRTFLEHRAHDLSRARTVIIEDRGLFALLFLNNNFHAVHHMHPGVAWYDLPALYRARKARFLEMNDGYVYPSYADIFRRYLWRAKDPVPHPLWSKSGR